MSIPLEKVNSLDHIHQELLHKIEMWWVDDCLCFNLPNPLYKGQILVAIWEVRDGLMYSFNRVPCVGMGVDVDFILAQIDTFLPSKK